MPLPCWVRRSTRWSRRAGGIPAAAALPSFGRAFSSRLLVARGRRYEFAHDVVQEALLAATPSPTLLAWHARAADLLSADPEAVARHTEAIGDRPRAARAWLERGRGGTGPLRGRDAILLPPARSARHRARGRGARRPGTRRAGAGHDAAATSPRRSTTTRRHVTPPAGPVTAAGDDGAAGLAGDVPVGSGGRPRTASRPSPSTGWPERSVTVGWRPTCWAARRCSAARNWTFTSAREAGPPRVGHRPRGRGRAGHARGLDAVKTACAYLGLVDELATGRGGAGAGAAPGSGDLWTMQWSVFESSFVPLAAGDDAAALDRIGAALEVCQRGSHRLRAVLRRAPGLGAPTGRPARPRRREGRRAVELAQRHRHTWWSTTASSLYAATLLACGDPGEAAAVADRPSGWPTCPARRPTCCAASDRWPRPPVTRPSCGGGPTDYCAPSGHRRAARGCSVPTPTWGSPAPGAAGRRPGSRPTAS